MEKKHTEKRVRNRYEGCSLYREAKEDPCRGDTMEGQRREKGEEGAGRGGRGSAGRRTAKPRQEAGGRSVPAGLTDQQEGHCAGVKGENR